MNNLAAGALILVLIRILEMEEAYRTINWQVILIIGSMYPISLALVNTGLSELIREYLLRIIRTLGPLGLALGPYLLSSFLTQLMGGQVTALVSGLITISATLSMHVEPHPVAIAAAIGCSASFFTPSRTRSIS